MKAIFVPLLALAIVGVVGPEPKALAGSPKAENSDLDLAKCALRRDECATAVKFCLNSADELTCKQAQYVCERVDKRCPK